MSVYKAINAVQSEIAKIGIAKDRRNSQQGYNFRGIDDVFNTLSPLLAKHGLCILPRVMYRTVQERATAKGGIIFYTTVEVEFDFVCAEDGSTHVVKTIGEAMDSGDKSTNKAMSAAYKYAAFQVFAIPTDGDNDADATTHEVAAQPAIDLEAITEALHKAPSLEALQAHFKAAWLQLDKAQRDAIKPVYDSRKNVLTTIEGEQA